MKKRCALLVVIALVATLIVSFIPSISAAEGVHITRYVFNGGSYENHGYPETTEYDGTEIGSFQADVGVLEWISDRFSQLTVSLSKGFSGTNAVQVPQKAISDGKDFTITTWFACAHIDGVSNASTIQRLVSTGSYGQDNGVFMGVLVTNTGNTYIASGVGNTSGSGAQFTEILTQDNDKDVYLGNRWTNLTLVVSGTQGKARLYMNAELKQEYDVSPEWVEAASQNAYIGGYKSGDNVVEGFCGYINEVGAINQALSAEEVKEYYDDSSATIHNSYLGNSFNIRFKEFFKEYDPEQYQNSIILMGTSHIEIWKAFGSSDAFLPFKSVNLGVGGSKACDIVKSEDVEKIAEYNPIAVYLLYGGNDFVAGRTEEQLAEDMETLLKRVKAAVPNAKIFVNGMITSPARLEGGATEYFKSTEEKYKELCDEYGATFISTIEETNSASYYQEDRTHFNAEGYKVMKEIVADVIVEDLLADDKKPIEEENKNTLFKEFNFEDNLPLGEIKGGASIVAEGDGHYLKSDGTGYIEFPSSNLVFDNGFTIAFKFKMDPNDTKYNSVQRIFSTGVWGPGEGGFTVGIYNCNENEKWSKLVCGVGSGSPALSWTDATELMDDGKWHQVIAVFSNDDKTISIYLDGTKVGFFGYPTDGTTVTGYEKTAIGGHLYVDGSFNEGFKGSLDDIFIIKEALDDSQVGMFVSSGNVDFLLSPNTGDSVYTYLLMAVIAFVIAGIFLLSTILGRKTNE